MTTTTSFSENNRFMSLYKSTLKQNRGMWIFLASVTFVILPFLNIIFYQQMKLRKTEIIGYSDPAGIINLFCSSELYNPVAAVLFTAIIIVCAIIFPILLNYYLFSKKAVDVYHSLPLSRQRLLNANTLAGLTIILSIVLFNLICAAVVDVIYRGMTPDLFIRLFSDIGAWISVIISCYAISTFAVIGVGTAFNALVYSLAFNFCLTVITLLADFSFGEFLIGYKEGDITELAIKLSPIAAMVEHLARTKTNSTAADLHSNAVALIIWAVFALILFAVSLKMYSRRKSEFAENTSTNNVLGVIIKLIGTFSCSIVFALFLASVNTTAQKTMFVIGCVIGAVFSYILIEAVLTRGFKTFKKALPLGAAMWALCIVFSVICVTGGFGYENRIPQAEKVESVTITYNTDNNYLIVIDENRYADRNNQDKKIVLTTKSAVDLIRDIHSESYNKLKSKKQTANNGIIANSITNDSNDTFYTGLQIEYKLKSGGTIKRMYSSCPVSSAQKFINLEAEAELKKSVYPVFNIDVQRITAAHAISADGISGTQIDKSVYKELIDALCADIISQDISDKTKPAQQQLGYVYFEENVTDLPQYKDTYKKYGAKQGAEVKRQSSVIVYKSFAKTIDVLKKYGLYDKMQSDTNKFDKVFISYEPFSDIAQSQQLYSPASCFSTVYYAAVNNQASNNTKLFGDYYSMQEKYAAMAAGDIKSAGFAQAVPEKNSLTLEFTKPEEISAVFNSSYINYGKLDDTILTVMLQDTETKQLAQLKLPLSKAPSFIKDKMAVIIDDFNKQNKRDILNK